MNQRIKNYTFVAASKQITLTDIISINIDEVSAIRNITTNDWIYRVTDTSADTITIAGNVITFTAANAGMANGDDLLIQIDQIGSQSMDESVSVVPAKIEKFRTSFASAVSNNVDTDYFTLVRTGTGMTVNQTGGNLVLTSGTTARSETIIRSNDAFMHSLHMKYGLIMSQRIANHQVFVELVDVVGDGLSYSIGSATAITVTIPNNPFTAVNIGQSVYIGNFNGTGTFLSGRYPIASISGNDVTFTVSAFAAGTGTCSLFGWNYYQLQYQGTTATQTNFDSQRNGYNSGFTTATISTTAGVGHMGIVTTQDDSVMYLDQLIASSATAQITPRASRVVGIPGEDVQLYLQIRLLNLGTSPASSTTSTFGFASVERFVSQNVAISRITPQTMQDALPIKGAVSGTVAATQSGAWSSRTQTGAGGVITGSYNTGTGASISLDVSPTIKQNVFSMPVVSGGGNFNTFTNINSQMVSITASVTSATATSVDLWLYDHTSGDIFYYFPRLVSPYTTTVSGVVFTPFDKTFTIGYTAAGGQITSGQIRYTDLPYNSPQTRVLRSRSLVTTGTNTSTEFINIEGFRSASLYVNMAAGGSNPSIALQTSMDKTNWVTFPATTLVSTVGTLSVIDIPSIRGRFARFVVTAAGAGSTLTEACAIFTEN